MTGDDLIALAAHLVANSAFGNAEARYRSAISRGYYGAFHLAVSFLNEVGGIRVLENHTGHEQVCRLLRGTGNATAIEAANSLVDLRSARNRADYKLQLRGFDSRPRAQEWVEHALRVKSWLDECRTEPTRSQILLGLKSVVDES